MTNQCEESASSTPFQEFFRTEAATGALAISRKAIVVTDDRKARHVFGERSPALTLRTTSEARPPASRRG